MMLPTRVRPIDDWVLFVEDGGLFLKSDQDVLKRVIAGGLTERDEAVFARFGLSASSDEDLAYAATLARVARRMRVERTLSYVIIVPTLRCDLSCRYCQVSRAPIDARGFDMDEACLEATLELLRSVEADTIKVEFQGGEPTLRLDLISRLMCGLDEAGRSAEFVICTNLQHLSDELKALLDRGDVRISTSFDGTRVAQSRLRTYNNEATTQFLSNFAYVRDHWGPDRISALPTVDYHNPPAPRALLDGFLELGMSTIYLRPMSYHGFARKQLESPQDVSAWTSYHSAFLDEVVRHNSQHEETVEEYYFSHCLRRIFQTGQNGHVDLRNPAPFGVDYLVVDYDGRIYPTDEARMLSRIREIDLSIGEIHTGVDPERTAALNGASLNNFDPDCSRCAFQPYCGPDPVDKVARHGRVDYPTGCTFHCQFHQYLFDRVFRMIYGSSENEHRSLAAWLDLPEWPTDLAPHT